MPSRVEKRGEGFLRTPPYRLLVLAGVLVLAAGGFVWAQEEAVQEEFLQEEPVSVEVSPQESGLPEQERESPDLLDPSAEAPGPPITLTIQEAIQAALTGNRQYLDRVDAIRQQFGIGEVLVEESLTVLPAGAGTVPGASTVSVSSQTTGLAAAKTQFETRITPSVSIRKNKAEGQELVESESLGVSIGKQFVTGGRLSVTSSLASVDFEERSSNLNLDFSQPLLRGAWPFVVNEGVVSARSNLRKQELALECCESTSRQGLIFEVISAYWNIQNQTELVDIARFGVERAERLYNATVAKQRVELATQLEVSRAEVQLSTQQAALSQARQELGNQKEAFKILIGMDSKERIELTDPVAFEPSDDITEEAQEEYIRFALENRPDLEVARIRVDDAVRKRMIARRNLLPDLSSRVGYGVSNVGGLKDEVDPNTGSWNASLSLSYPLPLNSRKINVEQSGVALQREERQLIEIKEEIAQQIKTDVRNVIKSREQVEIVRNEIKGAEKKLKIAAFRFERGLADNFDVVDAENNLIRARQNMTQTIINYRSALAELKKDMGVLSDEG